jgi:potassium-dependent mechanosensitive channel
LSDQLEAISNITIGFGDFSLQLGSTLIFLVSLVASFYIASLLKGLFYEEHRENASASDKTSVGSYVILFRLLIIGAGFIVGMIAAGIPLSNINLIIGALGVGIGFGLQNIVGNLVSGVILAFEKPIYVGDIIEMDGVKGKVSEIGIRATTVDVSEGSQYIIPNAEFITKNMKNWTLANKAMRIDTQVSTGLENDPDKIIRLLQESVRDTGAASRTRAPKITLREIRHNALVFGLQFWVDDIQHGDDARTEVLRKVHAAFAAEHVTYPRPEKNED